MDVHQDFRFPVAGLRVLTSILKAQYELVVGEDAESDLGTCRMRPACLLLQFHCVWLESSFVRIHFLFGSLESTASNTGTVNTHHSTSVHNDQASPRPPPLPQSPAPVAKQTQPAAAARGGDGGDRNSRSGAGGGGGTVCLGSATLARSVCGMRVRGT